MLPLILVLGVDIASVLADGDQSDSLENRFPYQAIVLAETAEVRSGPGAVHYSTDRLTQGSVVQVYRHDPGGWAAIRPPRGSFSLVPEGGIEILEDGSAVVAEDGVQAWVGTRLGAVENPLWQIKLKQGEEVEVLGEVSWPSPEGHSIIWYQIAPPAGEFRWIAMSDLQIPDDRLDLPEIAAASKTVDRETLSIHQAQGENWQTGPSLRQTDRADTIQPVGYEAEATVGPAANPPNSGTQQTGTNADNRGWRRASRPIRMAQAQNATGSTGSTFPPTTTGTNSVSPVTDSAIRRLPVRDDASIPNPAQENSGASDGRVEPASIEPASNNGHASDAEWLSGGAQPSTDVMTADRAPLLAPIGTLTERVGQLELLLTREMITPPETWRLDEIENMARQILAEGPGREESQQLERLLGKLANCRRIQMKYQQIDSSLSASSARPVGTGIDASVTNSTLYDAHGWLNELVQAGGTKPSTFVLQDANGKITHHISPAPGLNLRRYLKQRVGIIGERGFHRGYNLDHVTAERIIVLDRQR